MIEGTIINNCKGKEYHGVIILYGKYSCGRVGLLKHSVISILFRNKKESDFVPRVKEYEIEDIK